MGQVSGAWCCRAEHVAVCVWIAELVAEENAMASTKATSSDKKGDNSPARTPLGVHLLAGGVAGLAEACVCHVSARLGLPTAELTESYLKASRYHQGPYATQSIQST